MKFDKNRLDKNGQKPRGSGDFSSFGFRGEALSAISAMGDMTIATKTQDSAAFWQNKIISCHLFT